jgi:ketosteroid isomerase-like protein
MKTAMLVSFLALVCTTAYAQDSRKDEETLWKLEHDYWRYVEANDLAAYSKLWHKDFLGWPSVSAAPVRKNHITDWVTSQTSKGLTFKAGELKPAAVQVTGDMAMVCYWITLKWVDKDGNGPSQTVRITHAWRKTGDEWQIIGGMSMLETSSPK